MTHSLVAHDPRDHRPVVIDGQTIGYTLRDALFPWLFRRASLTRRVLAGIYADRAHAEAATLAMRGEAIAVQRRAKADA